MLKTPCDGAGAGAGAGGVGDDDDGVELQQRRPRHTGRQSHDGRPHPRPRLSFRS